MQTQNEINKMDIFRKTKKGNLHSYCIYLASMYFESFEDYINVENSCPRFYGNRNQFHYNPIPISEETKDFFENIQTQYVYSPNEQLIKKDSISKYSFQYPITYSNWVKYKKDKVFETPFGIIYTAEDRSIYGKRIPPQVTILDDNLFEKLPNILISLPKGLKEIRNRVFANCNTMTFISIPDNVTYIGHECFEKCQSLKTINPPSKWITYSNKFFSNKPFLSSFTLPPNYPINYPVETHDIEIPNFVTTISDYCFANSHKLTSLHIPTSVVKIGKYAFAGCTDLEEIVFPSTITSDILGVGCFYKSSKLDHINNKMIAENDKLQLNLLEKEQQTLENWINMKIDKVIFDSSFDNWSTQSSIFDSTIHLKRSLLFLIEEANENIKFGGYIQSVISKINSNLVNTPTFWIPDGNCFVFRCNNADGEMKQYDLRGEGGRYAFKLYSNTSSKLFKIGKKDIDIRKEKFSSYCYQTEKSSFDYGMKYNCLVENVAFTPKRIVVIQMKIEDNEEDNSN